MATSVFYREDNTCSRTKSTIDYPNAVAQGTTTSDVTKVSLKGNDFLGDNYEGCLGEVEHEVSGTTLTVRAKIRRASFFSPAGFSRLRKMTRGFRKLIPFFAGSSILTVSFNIKENGVVRAEAIPNDDVEYVAEQP